LKSVLEGWLNPSANGDEDTSTAAETLSSTAKNDEAPFDVDAPKASAAKEEASAKKIDDVASAFDDLFNS
jgi:cytochrome c556